MPKLSDTMTEGTLVKWLKQDGDRVDISEVIAEIETDKATMEMEAFDEGTLKIYATEGEKIPVGEPIGFIAGEGEDLPAATASVPPAASVTAAPPQPLESAKDATASTTSPAVTTSPTDIAKPATAPPSSGVIKASPVAVKLAAAKGISLATLTGSGPGGRIVKRDILAATPWTPNPPAWRTAPGEDLSESPSRPAPPSAATIAAPAPGPVRSPAPPPFSPKTLFTPPLDAPSQTEAPPAENGERIPLTGMRSIIAERLLASKTQIPHFYLHVELDAAPLMALRKQVNAAAKDAAVASPSPDAAEPDKYTINDFILKAAVSAAVAVPQVNASFAGDAVVRFRSVNLAIAVAVEDGLVTPVIRDAQARSLLEISRAVKDLAERARKKRLSPDEFQGGTLTVSNLGAYGIDSFDAIINPPQSVILSIGAITAKPVVSKQGEIVPGQRIDIGMSCDHRVVDGAIGARYLAEFRKIVENPALMLF